MQATALGRYLLYGTGGQMPQVGSARHGDVDDDARPVRRLGARDPERAPQPHQREQRHGPHRRQRRPPRPGRAGETRWILVPATGCAAFPDVEVGRGRHPVQGRRARPRRSRASSTPTPTSSAFRFLGGRFHCGRPWSPYGVTVALEDCVDHQPNGAAAAPRTCSPPARRWAPTTPTAGRRSRAGRGTTRSPTRAPTGGGSSGPGGAACGSW